MRHKATDKFAEALTMDRSAAALDVTHKTISNDLNEFVPLVQTDRPQGRPVNDYE